MNPFDIIAAFIEKAKEHIKEGVYDSREGVWPNLYPGYAEACKQLSEIAIHSTKSTFPKRHFERLLKEMDANGLKWLENNYQPTTHGVFNDFLNTSMRGTHNAYVQWDNVRDDVVEYITEKQPNYESLDSFFRMIAPKLILEDAMAVFTVKPEALQLTDPDENGVRYIVGDVNPAIQYYQTPRVIHYKHGQSCLILLHERSKIGQWKKEQGLVFEWYDQDRIIRLEQVGKVSDWQFEITFDFPHQMGYCPATRTKGIPDIVDNDIVYQSHFYAAVPFLNHAMHDAVYLEAVKRKCAFPTPVVVSDDCNYTDVGKASCEDGYLNYHEDGEAIHKICPRCNGSGKSQKLNPFSTYMVPAAKTGLDEANQRYTANDVLAYISPDPAILEFLRKEHDLEINHAREEIKISRTIGTEGHVTATERGIDHKATLAYIRSFIELLVDNWNWSMRVEVDMKWGVGAREVPVVLVPNDIDLKTTQDYLNELESAEKAGVGAIVKMKLIAEYLRQSIEGSPVAEAMMETIIAADAMFYVNDLDAVAMRDTLQPWELILHLRSYQIVSMLMGRNEGWIYRTLPDRIADVQDEAKMLVPAPRANALIESIAGEDE